MLNLTTQNKNGTFLRKHNLWTPEHWEDGYTDKRGRFRVYRPDYPRSYGEGYALRAHVVWWLAHGRIHPKNTELHHKDGTTNNDVLENLIPLTKSQHRIFHQRKLVTIICQQCGKTFQEKAWRVAIRGRKYCSYRCYHKHPKSQETRDKIAAADRAAWKRGRQSHQ